MFPVGKTAPLRGDCDTPKRLSNFSFMFRSERQPRFEGIATRLEFPKSRPEAQQSERQPRFEGIATRASSSSPSRSSLRVGKTAPLRGDCDVAPLYDANTPTPALSERQPRFEGIATISHPNEVIFLKLQSERQPRFEGIATCRQLQILVQ